MYFDDLDRRRLCEDDVRVLRENRADRVRSAGDPSRDLEAVFRVAYLAARRMLLQLWNLPREIMELPEGHPHRLIAASVVLYALTAVAILAGVVRLVTTP
jgi:hypothetical protein